MRSAATIAIVTTRLRKELRILILAAAACALLAYLQRYDDAAAQLAGCLVFGTLTGVAVSLLQRGGGRFRELELCEQSAPLYGRELARATALVTCIVVTAAMLAYWAVASLYVHPAAAAIALAACASYAATLVAMSATVRSGLVRVLYIALACSISAAAFALMRWPAGIALMFCIVSGFIALRQYGEALASYDPV
jgi:hypothetical protein